MTHFKSFITLDMRNKIKTLADNLELSDLVWHESLSGYQTVDAIYGTQLSGWIPLQDGGFTVSTLVLNGVDNCLTSQQASYNAKVYDEMLESFKLDLNIDEIDYGDETITNQLYSYESEWFEPALLHFDIFIQDNLVRMRLCLNYKDAPYYRVKDAETLHEVDFDFDTFMAHDVDTLLEIFKANINE